MIDPSQLIFSYRWTADAFVRLVSDVPDEQMAKQPVEAINHPAWLFGHVGIYHGVIVRILAGETFNNPWDAPCGKNSAPSPDRSIYPAKAEILQKHQASVDEAIAAIENAPADAWAAAIKHDSWGTQFNSAAPAVIFLATTHFALHAGQLSGWRRAMGLPRI